MIHNPPLKSATSMTSMYAGGFLLAILFGLILRQIGSPTGFVNLMMLAFVLGTYLVAGLLGKTIRYGTFQDARRATSPFHNGLVIASGMISSGVFIFLAGDFYNGGTDALALFSGWILGAALLTVLFSAAYTRAKATTPAMLLQPDSTGRLLRSVAMMAVVICSSLLLVAQFSMIGKLGASFFNIPNNTGIYISAFAIGTCLLLGGIQSLTIARGFAYPVIFIAFMMPLILTTLKITGNPIPQLTIGSGALQPVSEINQEMIEAGFAASTDVFSFAESGRGLDGFNFIATLLCLAFGIAAMPHLLQHFGTVEKAQQARRSGLWALILILPLLTAVPALTAFAQLEVYTSLLGLPLSGMTEDADWLFALSGSGNMPLISICGMLVKNAGQVVSACGNDPDHILRITDITLNSDFLVLGSALLNELPEIMTAVLAAGAMIALWSTADGLALITANSMANDGYLCLFRPKSPLSVRLFMARFFLIVTITACAYLAAYYSPDTRLVFSTAVAMTAASLFPALISRVWFSGTSGNQILTGILSGFVVTSALLAFSILGPDFTLNTGDEVTIGVPMLTDEIKPMSSGLIGALFATAAMYFTYLYEKHDFANRKKTKRKQSGKTDVPA